MGPGSIPWQDIQVALVYQNNPGPGYTTNITYSNAQIAPTLGRPLSVGATQDDPGGRAEHAVRSADSAARHPRQQVRPAAGRPPHPAERGPVQRGQLEPRDRLLPTYNLADQGATWKRPTQVFDGRLAKFSVQFDF